MAAKLSKRLLDRLAAEAAADPSRAELVWDDSVPGFYVRVRSGRLTFGYSYRVRGRERRMVVGRFGPLTLDQARDGARSLYAAVKAGGDPLEQRREGRQRRATVAEVAELYLDDLRERAATGATRGRRSTVPEWERLVHKVILPRLGSIELERLGLEQVESWHRSLAATPTTGNRALTVLSAIVRFAERRRFRPQGQNPCPLVTRFREEPARERLTLDQLAQLGEALRGAEGAGVHPSPLLAIRLLALTGMRRSEVCGHGTVARRSEGDGLRWGDVNLETRTIQLRSAKAGARGVPLGLAAVEILRSAKPADADPQAFVCPGARPGQPFIGLDKVRRQVFGAAGIEKASLHALRRTFASVAADAGMGEFIIAGLLGHRGGSVTSRYVSPERDPLHHAAELVSRTIAAALAGSPPAAIVEFPAVHLVTGENRA
jgi:integrase